MRIPIIIVMFMFCGNVGAASANWTGLAFSNTDYGSVMEYFFGADIHGENGKSSWIHTSMSGYMENGEVYLKQFDFSQEMMEPTFNWWALVLYGDIVSETTFAVGNPNRIALGRWSYPRDVGDGGTLVENPDDFYMAFKVSEVLSDSTGYVEGMSWYGWVHVSIDDNLEMTLLDSGIDLYGGAVTVGAGIPEPSGGVLMLLGLAALRLRRRAHGSVTFLAVLKPVKGTCISFK